MGHSKNVARTIAFTYFFRADYIHMYVHEIRKIRKIIPKNKKNVSVFLTPPPSTFEIFPLSY